MEQDWKTKIKDLPLLHDQNHPRFQLTSPFAPAGDQPKAIYELYENLKDGVHQQVLLGATGTGKTFTMANIIQKNNQKALVIAHNKTLAAQLYSELKELFPHNHVEYFVSYFDYYQPEAYVPRTDTYIEKSSKANDEIKMMRLSTLNSLVNYDDVIVVASVASIYISSSPESFVKYKMFLKVGLEISMKQVREGLVRLHYERSMDNLQAGTFRQNGDIIEIVTGYDEKYSIQISFFGDEIESIIKRDALNGTIIEKLDAYVVYPADEYVADYDFFDHGLKAIEQEMQERVKYFNQLGKPLEAERIEQRTRWDMESLLEFGYCSGIENYSVYLEGRKPHSTPFTLFSYFEKEPWLLIIDESHMTIPQIKGMYETDRSRKQTLIEYGFRLPSAADNRPLMFDEFEAKQCDTIYVSATPNPYEIDKSHHMIVEQIVRPTGLLDPVIEVHPTKNQMDDVLEQIRKQIAKNERSFLNVMTIRMAEELTKFLQNNNIKAAYLHNELKTLERSKILNDLRRGLYDVVVGINLLREGIDIPEVSLIAIFDADKPGFFRSEKALIQIIGRAARNASGKVIMYADEITLAMHLAIEETKRRREIQEEYNRIHHIIPKTIEKSIREDLSVLKNEDVDKFKKSSSKKDKESIIKDLTKQMLDAAKERDYEKAAKLRDIIIDLELEMNLKKTKKEFAKEKRNQTKDE